MERSILVHLGSGLGNMLMVTPMIKMLSKGGIQVDLCVQGETPGVEHLFERWPYVRKVSSASADFRANNYEYYLYGVEVREPPIEFVNRDKAVVLHPMWDRYQYDLYSEIELYTNLARCIVPDAPMDLHPECTSSGRKFPEISAKTCVIAPGGQRHLQIRKWLGYGDLARHLPDVAVVGTKGDMDISNRIVFPGWVRTLAGEQLNYPGRFWRGAHRFAKRLDQMTEFPGHAKNYVGQLSLADTASLIEQAGCVIGNDCGLTHLAIALGKPTIVLLGPTSQRKVFPSFLKDVTLVKKNFECQPCQENPRLRAWRISNTQVFCPFGIRCMEEITVENVLEALARAYPEALS
ncbi:hypothetical protein sS8_0465 [Methylocaldum marinum]|uniref:Glycosyltransferase family 9 protein n=1 Tax=Methylocaldum marinum TaxID=1432792 RepID=A0A286P459_9GAMM|nr:glycosyltransferase family 9 protein [Methylocaldum marinum]BBA32431.1 hypothetical protein sS8_0465 [Methylocaldum marinum]